jgi:hypothetical protein
LNRIQLLSDESSGLFVPPPTANHSNRIKILKMRRYPSILSRFSRSIDHQFNRLFGRSNIVRSLENLAHTDNDWRIWIHGWHLEKTRILPQGPLVFIRTQAAIIGMNGAPQ